MTSKRPHHPAAATLVPTYPRWILHMQRDLGHDRDAVWHAITRPELIAQWAPFRPDRNISTEGPVRLKPVDADDEPIDGEVLETTPEDSLTYTWDTDRLRFGLTETDAGIRLTLAHTMDDRHSAASVAAGWHLCFDALEMLLAGDEVPSMIGDQAKEHGWDDLQRDYEAMFDEQADASNPRDETEE